MRWMLTAYKKKIKNKERGVRDEREGEAGCQDWLSQTDWWEEEMDVRMVQLSVSSCTAGRHTHTWWSCHESHTHLLPLVFLYMLMSDIYTYVWLSQFGKCKLATAFSVSSEILGFLVSTFRLVGRKCTVSCLL